MGTTGTPPLQWDLYCRVVDNLGDVGVCWRLACALARRGQQVRLVIDDGSALAWLAPQGHRGVDVLPWGTPARAGDVVIEAFGCALPPATEHTLAARHPPPVWINLEHLSAEPFVERSHGLPSPQPGGLVKWFFYPGFTARTGGLLHEPQQIAEQQRLDRRAWLACHGILPQPGERVVSLFCYDSAPVAQLLPALAAVPTLLLLTPGPAQRLAAAGLPPTLRAAALPWLTQQDYDHLLWVCGLNFVRGEDSLVRALLAGQPCVWQAYAQDDGVHHRKVQALIEQFAPVPLPVAVQAVWRAWNGAPGAAVEPGVFAAGAAAAGWAAAAGALRQRLLQQPDLATQLLRFVWERRVEQGLSP